MKRKIKLTKDDTRQGIPHLLECIAERMGIVTENVEYYNITKITIAENIHDALIQHYVDEGMSKLDVMALFTCYAPKASGTLEENQILVADGFCLLKSA